MNGHVAPMCIAGSNSFITFIRFTLTQCVNQKGKQNKWEIFMTFFSPC